MIPTWLQAVLLGLVQGLTEFIPVSSSGHLVLVPYLFSWESPGLAFDVALHVGTAGAIVVYFRRDLAGMVLAVLGRGGDRQVRLYRRVVMFLAVASVPVAVAGLALKETFEAIFERPPVAAGFLFATAAVLLGGEWLRSRRVAGSRAAAPSRDAAVPERLPAVEPTSHAEPLDAETGSDPADPTGRDLEGMGLRQALAVGLAQTLALFPGMSRSGTTIMAGVATGLTRAAATRFAFLLGLPAMVGAAVLSAPDLGEPGPYGGVDIALGVGAAFVAGYAAIAFLVRLVSRTSLRVFVGYLVAAGAVGLVASALLGPPPA